MKYVLVILNLHGGIVVVPGHYNSDASCKSAAEAVRWDDKAPNSAIAICTFAPDQSGNDDRK
jgi:hypothetical protein